MHTKQSESSLTAYCIAVTWIILYQPQTSECGLAHVCLPPTLEGQQRVRQKSSTPRPNASKPSALTVSLIGFIMARNPHVSIGYDGRVLLHHRRRRDVDKSCAMPFDVSACQRSRTVNEQVLFYVSFPSVFLLLYEQSHVFMDLRLCLKYCRYVNLDVKTMRSRWPQQCESICMRTTTSI